MKRYVGSSCVVLSVVLTVCVCVSRRTALSSITSTPRLENVVPSATTSTRTNAAAWKPASTFLAASSASGFTSTLLREGTRFPRPTRRSCRPSRSLASTPQTLRGPVCSSWQLTHWTGTSSRLSTSRTSGFASRACRLGAMAGTTSFSTSTRAPGRTTRRIWALRWARPCWPRPAQMWSTSDPTLISPSLYSPRITR